MKIAAAAVAVALSATVAAAAENCQSGGIPGLAAVASKLNVPPSRGSAFALQACNGRTYDIGTLLDRAVTRIEKAERDAAKALQLAAPAQTIACDTGSTLLTLCLMPDPREK